MYRELWYQWRTQQQGDGLDKFFIELRRRNVFRISGLYAVVAWLILQVIAVLTPALNLPDWVDSFFAVTLIAGFPIAVLLAWAFEMTSEGVKRTQDVDSGASISDKTGRRLDVAILVSLVVVGGLVIGTRQTGPSAVVVEPSIAVLPFTDRSVSRDQGYFSDGLSEEILNLLAQVPNLSVAGRTSSFAFKNKEQDIREIGEILNVDHILEGSVRKSGDKIRVTAQLVNVDTGFHLWSATYDRDLNDIFAVQDEISEAILQALMPKLLGDRPTVSVKRTEIAAYDLYLAAQHKASSGSLRGYQAANAVLDKALAIDPDYVPALAWRSYYEMMASDAAGAAGEFPAERAFPLAKAWSDRAMELDPKSPDALFSRAGIRLFSFGADQRVQAEHYLQLAIAARPNFAQARNDLGFFLVTQNRIEEAITQFEIAIAHDPGQNDVNVNLLALYGQRREIAKARKLISRWSRIAPDSAGPLSFEAGFYGNEGDLSKSIEIMKTALALEPDNPRTQRNYYGGYLGIGEFDIELPENVNFLKTFGFLLQGRREEALSLAREQIADRPDFPAQQQGYVGVLQRANQWDEIVTYYDKTWGSIGALQLTFDRPDFANLAGPLLGADHADGPRIAAAERRAINARRNLGMANHGLDMREAKQLVLEGEMDAAMTMLEAAFDRGMRNFDLIMDPGYFALRDMPRYQTLVVKFAEAINVERAELGLDPMEMPKPYEGAY